MNRYLYPTNYCVLKIIEHEQEMLAMLLHEHYLCNEELKEILDEILEDLFQVMITKSQTSDDYTDSLNVYEAIEALYFFHFGVSNKWRKPIKTNAQGAAQWWFTINMVMDFMGFVGAAALRWMNDFLHFSLKGMNNDGT